MSGRQDLISIAMLRRRATDPARRIGSLFVNPGGPGTSGLHMAYRAERILAPDVVARYDIIGFDPRGVGLSGAVKCFESQEQYEQTFASRLVVPVTKAEVTAAMRAYRDYALLCAGNAGPLLPHLTTLNVARDLDLMRSSVGEEHLNFVGLSYGTMIGATYANLYPERVRAMVLDGNVDPQLRTHNGLEYDRQRAAGLELVLNAFLDYCTAAGSSCAFSEGDVRAKFVLLRERLRQGPVVLPDGTQVTLSNFTGRLVDGLSVAAQLPELARSLADLYELVQQGTEGRRESGPTDVGSAGWFAIPAADVAGRETTGETPYRFGDSGQGFNCLDKPYPPAPTVLPVLARLWEHESPTFGRMHAFEGVPCTVWPVHWWNADRFSGPWNRNTAETVLLLGNRYDAITRYDFARSMASHLANATLVTVDSFGHTALGLNECADEISTRYLLHGELPSPGMTCSANSPAFPTVGA
ncbi:alpha/beta hydrolase [Rhizocola hellebori]|nr:alpha/beta hydrolase [Rhizocola hellebori]